MKRVAFALEGLGMTLISAVSLSALMVYAAEPGDAIRGSKAEQQTIQEHKPAEPKIQALKPQEPKAQEPAGKSVRSVILATKLALMADRRVFAYDIAVDASGPDVVLSGKVPNEAEKLAAVEVAQKVDGVKSVVNKLEVVPGVNEAIKRERDEAITQYVKERFAKSKTLQTAGFDVKTDSGVVELSGKTRFQVIVLEAAEAARQVPGVKAVKTDAVRLESAE